MAVLTLCALVAPFEKQGKHHTNSKGNGNQCFKWQCGRGTTQKRRHTYVRTSLHTTCVTFDPTVNGGGWGVSTTPPWPGDGGAVMLDLTPPHG